MPKKSSSSTGLIILFILLILSIGGFGYWNYTMYQTIQELDQGQAPQFYYANHTAVFTSASEDTYYDIPDLSISIDVAADEEVHIMFTCFASLTAVSAVTVMHFLVKIDTTQILESKVIVGYTGVLGLVSSEYSVTLQYLDDTLSAGSHTITIITMRECDGFIQNSNLFVQVY